MAELPALEGAMGDGSWTRRIDGRIYTTKLASQGKEVREFSRLLFCEDIQSCGPELREAKKSTSRGAAGKMSDLGGSFPSMVVMPGSCPSARHDDRADHGHAPS